MSSPTGALVHELLGGLMSPLLARTVVRLSLEQAARNDMPTELPELLAFIECELFEALVQHVDERTAHAIRDSARQFLAPLLQPPPAPTPAPAPAEVLILVIDDDPLMHRLLGVVLKELGEVVLAEDGVEGLQRAQQRRPDVIVTDLVMPNMDGFALLERLRSHATLNDVPVIVLSARVHLDAARESLAAGAASFVMKPFVADELRDAVRAALDDAPVNAG